MTRSQVRGSIFDFRYSNGGTQTRFSVDLVVGYNKQEIASKIRNGDIRWAVIVRKNAARN